MGGETVDRGVTLLGHMETVSLGGICVERDLVNAGLLLQVQQGLKLRQNEIESPVDGVVGFVKGGFDLSKRLICQQRGAPGLPLLPLLHPLVPDIHQCSQLFCHGLVGSF